MMKGTNPKKVKKVIQQDLNQSQATNSTKRDESIAALG
jgi:hypothetical protein